MVFQQSVNIQMLLSAVQVSIVEPLMVMMPAVAAISQIMRHCASLGGAAGAAWAAPLLSSGCFDEDVDCTEVLCCDSSAPFQGYEWDDQYLSHLRESASGRVSGVATKAAARAERDTPPERSTRCNASYDAA